MLGGQRLLLVDDEPDLRAMVADYLGRHGYIVETAANGGELDKHLNGVPDLVILDVNFPAKADSTLPVVSARAAMYQL
jgi:two-component system OmpR family response regulator